MDIQPLILTRLNKTKTDLNFINGSIREFDIEKAYISIIKSNWDNINYLFTNEQRDGLIKLLEELEYTDKKEYLIFIGKLMNDVSWLSDFLHEHLKYILNKFAYDYQIQECNLIGVKKDALFLVGFFNKNNVFLIDDKYKIREKNSYTLFYHFKINGRLIEVYYNENNNTLDIKGTNDNNWLAFIKYVNDELISKLLYLDSNDRMKFIDLFESRFLNEPEKLTLYDKFERIKLKEVSYYVSIKEAQKYNELDYILENVDTEYYYFNFLKPILGEIFTHLI